MALDIPVDGILGLGHSFRIVTAQTTTGICRIVHCFLISAKPPTFQQFCFCLLFRTNIEIQSFQTVRKQFERTRTAKELELRLFAIADPLLRLSFQVGKCTLYSSNHFIAELCYRSGFFDSNIFRYIFSFFFMNTYLVNYNFFLVLWSSKFSGF